MQKSEDNLIAWIASRCRTQSGMAEVPIGIGDDMAMIRTSSGEALLTSDMLMDGVDFDTAKHTPEQIGRKALAVSLSDCAAMAVWPRWALVSIALPNSWTMEMAQRLFQGLEGLARRYVVAIVGGDTNSWNQPLAIDVTVVAEPWPGIKPVQRKGMQPQDLIVVSGKLGGSLAGQHLEFEPRVLEARWLADTLGDALHAMIDLSDGLSIDAHRLAKASDCGIVFDGLIPESLASTAAINMAQEDGRSILDHILNDGEDFELLFAVKKDAWLQLNASSEGFRLHGLGTTPIGTATKQLSGVWIERPGIAKVPIEPRGWQHFK